ncbi:MAG: hypothetical protein R3D68_04710 [Hyphomicrobiaceae bacterium]
MAKRVQSLTGDAKDAFRSARLGQRGAQRRRVPLKRDVTRLWVRVEALAADAAGEMQPTEEAAPADDGF